jgi:ribonuclease P protein component
VKVTQTLRMNYEFSRVYHKGRFLSGRYTVLHYLRRGSQPNRLGVTASRRIKGSVRRNRIKRLLRESYRLVEDQLAAGYDLILVGRETDGKPDFHAVSQEVGRLFQRSGLLKPQTKSNDKDGLQEKSGCEAPGCGPEG